MSRLAAVACQNSAPSESFSRSAAIQTTPVTNRTANAVYSPQRKRRSSCSADAIVPVRSDPHIAGIEDEERAGLILRKQFSRAFAADHDDFGQRIGDHAGWRPHCRA